MSTQVPKFVIGDKVYVTHLNTILKAEVTRLSLLGSRWQYGFIHSNDVEVRMLDEDSIYKTQQDAVNALLRK